LREQSKAKTIVATTAAMPAAVRAQLEKKHIEVMQCAGNAAQRVDMYDLIQRLGRQGMLSLLCEGGPTLAAALLNAQCVQQLHWIIAEHIIGSAEAVPVLAQTSARRVRIQTVNRLGADALIIASPEY
jgi:diaminohydroxyphosphoribosylaminopyrimidine deaminase/5-amino-6-(5-phosphoribosylamino)uracil reductase